MGGTLEAEGGTHQGANKTKIEATLVRLHQGRHAVSYRKGGLGLPAQSGLLQFGCQVHDVSTARLCNVVAVVDAHLIYPNCRVSLVWGYDVILISPHFGDPLA